jgi:hypothetical protein
MRKRRFSEEQELEDENRRLKQIVADQALDVRALKSASEKSREHRRSTRARGVLQPGACALGAASSPVGATVPFGATLRMLASAR